MILAALLTAPALVANWASRTLLDSERYVSTIGPLATSAQVQEVIADITINALEKRVDVQQLLDEAFVAAAPDRARLRRLVPVLAAAVNGAIEREVRAFVASEAFEDRWITINARAHQGFVRGLRGEPTSVVSVRGDALVLDVSDVVEEIRRRLVARGLTVLENVPIPRIDTQLVLFRGPQLARARVIYAFAAPVAAWALPMTGLLCLAAVALAVRRPRMLVVVGVAAAGNAVLVAFALAAGQQLAVHQLSDTVLAPAAAVVVSALVQDLERGRQLLLGIGIVLVVAGWFAGTSSSGTAVRQAVSTALHRAGASRPPGPGD